jgi:hypothetical protein
MTLLLSRQDLKFLFHDWPDTESLPTRPRFAKHSRKTLYAVLTPLQRSARMTSERLELDALWIPQPHMAVGAQWPGSGVSPSR